MAKEKKEKEERLTLKEKAEIRRELSSMYRNFRANGMDHTEAADATRESAKGRYGSNINWTKIIEILMMLLDLFADDND